MKIVTHATACIAALSMTGCGIAAKVNARNDMEQSKVSYKQCLSDNPNNIKACESARLAYEADIKAYRATASGIQPGTNNTINVNTSSDQ